MSEVVILPLEQQIENELQRENVTDKVINELKSKYNGLKLAHLEDKETYLEIKEAKKEVAKWRILAQKICKSGREDAIKIQKLWVEKEKEVVGKIAEIEDPLKAELDKFDAEVERKENEQRQKREEAYINRQAELTKMGATYSNGAFVLGDVSFDANIIKDADDEIYVGTIFPKFNDVYQKLEAERIAEEQRKAAEAAELKRKQDELDRRQREFEEKQREFQRQQEEAERQARELQLQKEKAELEARQKLINHRSAVLSGLGMQFNGSEYKYEDVNVHTTEMGTLSENDWVELVQKITPVIEQRKKEAADRAAEAAAQKERERIAEEQRKEAIRKQEEEERKALELAQSTDKTKWAAFLEQLNQLVHQEMKSPKYRRMQQIAKEKIEEIYNL